LIDKSFDYYDDPIEETPAPRRKVPGILASILILLAGSLFLNTTLAGNIRINSGSAVEFGQTMAATTACSGANILTIKPISDFANSSGAGDFLLKALTVSGIPIGCYGEDFAISVFDSSTSTALPIFASTKTVARIWDDAGTFKLGTGSASGLSVTSNSGAFTVTFTTPLALSTNIAKLTIQSATHVDLNCALDLICATGDTGPGGGTVFYVNATGFNCGPNFTATGSPTGDLCHYLEYAPPTWSGSTADPRGPLTTSASSIASVAANPPRTLSQMGLGYKYSEAINAVFGTCSAPVNNASRNITNCPTVVAAARAYAGRGLTDWYLPNAAELNVACQYARGGQAINPDVACSTAGSNPVAWTNDDTWSSTAVVGNLDRFYALHMQVTSSFQQMTGQAFNLLAKPIRAF